MKTFNELKIGDYIFHKCKEFPLIVEPKRIVNIYKFHKETIFEICWFGSYAKCTITKLHVDNQYMNKDKVPDEHYDFNDFWYTTEHICESKTGIGHYIYNNAKDFDHREYEVIQENILFKDLDIEPDCIDGEYIERNIYFWRKNNNLILYKALYDDCPDGQYFVRHAEDFYNNFTKIY